MEEFRHQRAGPPAPSFPPAQSDEEAIGGGWRRSDLQFWLILGLILVLLLGVLVWRRSSHAAFPLVIVSQQPPEFFYAVEMNSATWVEWSQLPGIGETLAKRIVADREEHGPFSRPEDLQRVKGIGPKTYAELKTYLSLSPSTCPVTDAVRKEMEN